MKQFLDSDWLRTVQFFGTTVQKKGILPQSVDFSLADWSRAMVNRSTYQQITSSLGLQEKFFK